MQYAIFDLDGTIVDSMSMWRNVSNAYLAHNGYPPFDDLKNLDNHIWLAEFIKIAKQRLDFVIDKENFQSWIYDYALNQYSFEIKPKAHALQFLDKLYNDDVKMCICSSTDRELMLPLLERLDILKYFEFTCHCNEFGSEKDSPEIFLHCMEKLGAKNPCDIVVFEDAYYAAKTAKETGFYVVGIFDAQENNPDGFKQTVDCFITDYQNLLDIKSLKNCI